MKQKTENKRAKKILLVGDDDPYSDELSEIKAEIASLSLVVTRVLENSNRQQMNIMMTDFREELSQPVLNYMLDDTRESIGCMSKTCEHKIPCQAAFGNLLQNMVLLLLKDNISEEVLEDYQQQFDELISHATTDNCDNCVNYASNAFNKQMGLIRSFCNHKNIRDDGTSSASTSTLSEDVVKELVLVEGLYERNIKKKYAFK